MNDITLHGQLEAVIAERDTLQLENARVRQETIEECAKVCEEQHRVNIYESSDKFKLLDEVAAALRSLPVNPPQLQSARLAEALTRLRNECDLEGLREKAGFDCWLNLADEALRSLPPAAKINQNDNVHLDKPLAGSAIAPSSCGAVPDERAAFESFMRRQSFLKYDLKRNQYGEYKETSMQQYWEVWQAALSNTGPMLRSADKTPTTAAEATCQKEGIAVPTTQVPDDELLDWLETEVSAIDTRYRGNPSNTHDAYWFKDQVFQLLKDARKAFAASAAPSSSADQTEREALPMLCYELDGVIFDIEREGFDEVCLNTLKRVRAALSRESSAAIGELPPPNFCLLIDELISSWLAQGNEPEATKRRVDARQALEQALAAAQPNALIPEGEPLATLILGGIEGDELGDNDIELHTKLIEALQDKLVRTSNPVYVPLYAAAPMLNTQEPK